MNDKEWSNSIGKLAADALIDAKKLKRTDFSVASEIIAEEILVRLASNDRPKRKRATRRCCRG